MFEKGVAYRGKALSTGAQQIKLYLPTNILKLESAGDAVQRLFKKKLSSGF